MLTDWQAVILVQLFKRWSWYNLEIGLSEQFPCVHELHAVYRAPFILLIFTFVLY